MLNYRLQLSAMLLLISIIFSTCMSTIDFQCFNDSEINTIYYTNNASTPVPVIDLPTVRIMTCLYESQCITNFAAYLYLKEIVGINVTFYPDVDPSQIWSYLGNINDNQYPEIMFSWLENDDNDLNFEWWPNAVTMSINNWNDYATSKNIHLGSIGAYVDVDIWIPKYFVDQYPDAIVPYKIQTDLVLRELFINGSQTGGSVNYTQLYAQNAVDIRLPPVWIPFATFDNSRYFTKLTNNTQMNISIISTQSIFALSALVIDLYQNRAPFMVMTDTLDEVFATLDPLTQQLPAFEKIWFPRNPSKSQTDTCYKAAQCEYPMMPLKKAANLRLQDRFSEIYEFYINFEMDIAQMHLLRSKYLALSDDTTQTERWLQAACEWLQDSKSISTWNGSWDVDIKRYYCYGNTSMNECEDRDDITDLSPIDSFDELAFIIYILIGVVSLLIIITMVYKTAKFCRDFQNNWAAQDTDTKQIKLIKQEKRKLFVAIFANLLSMVLGVIDCGTDCGSLVSITNSTTNDYSDAYIIGYFVLIVIALFVSSIHIFVAIQIIFVSFIEYRKEAIICEDEELSRLTNTKQKEINELLFKSNVIEKELKNQTITVAVAFAEDLPFMGLNLYALYTDTVLNQMLLISTLFSCIGLGFKICTTKMLFGNLQARNQVKRSLQKLKKEDTELTEEMICNKEIHVVSEF
eukprot:237581_1